MSQQVTIAIPNSNVLINLLGITNGNDLHAFELKFVGLRASEILEKPTKGDFDFEHLKAIHKFLFQDVYSWAGKIRTCNIAKLDLFCLCQHIDRYAEEIFTTIMKNNYFMGLEHKEKMKRLVYVFANINLLHPFREGNGRTQREFVRQLANVNGIDLDFDPISNMEMIIASHESTHGQMDKLLSMFEKIATPISKEEQAQFIENYIKNEKLKAKFKDNMEQVKLVKKRTTERKNQ